MKIRHPALLRAGGFAGALFIQGLVGSLRRRVRSAEPDIDPSAPAHAGRYLYAFWHEYLLLATSLHGTTPTKVLISLHADGEFIAHACRHLRLGVVRGSTTRGGVQAVRDILALGGKYDIVMTPDGPRGPRRRVQPGLAFLASRTGLPVVPCGFAYRRAWRLPSWDRFAVPCPFSPAVGVLGEAIRLPAGLGRDDLETARLRIESAMAQATRLADEWAQREEW